MTEVTNTVRFALDGQIVEVKGERRTTTVLNYLREELRRTGTKEGCAEGDCGACVVLVGELNADASAIDYVPVNSCLQLLPTLDGKSLKTVESLGRAKHAQHPIQEAMVNCHASQCGFCTPGIVMSLVHMTQVTPNPSRQDITDALSGNLCRCTGYKPIIDAAQKACQGTAPLSLQNPTDIELLKEIKRSEHPTLSLEGELIVQPVVRTRKGNEFVSPGSLAELAHYLLRHPHATLVAGSSEVGLQVNKDFVRPDHIVYVGHVKEFSTIETHLTHWKVGAGVGLQAVMELCAKELPDFSEVLRRFGSPPIRYTATLAGNIANGSPIGDSMPCLMALGSMLGLRLGETTREVALEDFYTGIKKNILQPGEFIEYVTIPRLKAQEHFRAHKVSKRFEQDISATCAAMRFKLVNDQLFDVRLAYNGLSPFPARAKRLEQVLEGQRVSAVSESELDLAIKESFTPRDGLRATWAYRALLARNLVLKFIQPLDLEVSPS
jgi:xanthine dehydrogenase small subunit